MLRIEEEKNKLMHTLSEHYAQNIITIEEYERILEYIQKIETIREIHIVEKIIQEQTLQDALIIPANNKAEKHLALFSWNTLTVKSVKGNGGNFISLFGTNRILVDNLPRGKTVIQVNAIFGLTEIVVSKNIKIINKTVPIFSGIFAPPETNKSEEVLPELYILGKAVFGNISIIRN